MPRSNLRPGWSRFQRDPLGRRWCVWVAPERGAVVRHCGHPTALRPYRVTVGGLEIEQKFRTLEAAMIAAETAKAVSGVRADPIPRARTPTPGRPAQIPLIGQLELPI